MCHQRNKLGIVCRPADEKGEVLVQIQKKKQLINHKRLKLKTKAEDMYPEDYDFSVIFDPVENRKARKKMRKVMVKAIRLFMKMSFRPDFFKDYEATLIVG